MMTGREVADDGDDPLEGSDPDPAPTVDAFTLPPGADPTLDWGLTSHLDADGRPRIVERHLIVPPELGGLRLDHFVKTQITRLSRTKIQTIIATQLRRADGHVPKPSTTVVPGEHYVIRRAARPEPPCPRTFSVLLSDPRLYVVDKPAFLPVHASAKFYFNTLTRVLAERFRDEPDLQICHRLDRETSGCLVVARDREAAVFLKDAFATKAAIARSSELDRTAPPQAARRLIVKQYVALVHGDPPWPDTGAGDHVIDVPLRLSQPGDATRLPHVRMLPGPGGLPSITRVSVDRRSSEHALVRCTLVTGRQHQIRAHLAAVGFPIVGDKLYAHGDDAFIEFCDRGLTPELAARFVLPRHALHAAHLTFPHPDGGSRRADAPIPPDLTSLLR